MPLPTTLRVILVTVAALVAHPALIVASPVAAKRSTTVRRNDNGRNPYRTQIRGMRTYQTTHTAIRSDHTLKTLQGYQ